MTSRDEETSISEWPSTHDAQCEQAGHFIACCCELRWYRRELAARRAAPPSSEAVATLERKIEDVVRFIGVKSGTPETVYGAMLHEIRTLLYASPQPSSDARAVALELTKRVERKAQALADDPENGYVEGDTNAFIWTNSEAEWQNILLDELAEEFRAYAATLPQSEEGS